MAYVMLIAGFAVLVVAGDFLVRGAVALASRLSIPPLLIGLTIVAFGTSAPELVVSLRAALSGIPDIAVGNIVGSNITNVLLVMGLPALIRHMDCCGKDVNRNTLAMVGASALFAFLCWLGPLGFWQGALLFSLLLLFLFDSAMQALRTGNGAAVVDEDTAELIEESNAGLRHGITIFLALLVGLVGLPLGAHLTVDGASGVARALGVSEAAIALSAVALGTSLPELVTSIACTVRGHGSMAIGNVLGSNLFNILAVMGLTAMASPMPVPDAIIHTDIWIMLGTAVLVVPFAMGKLRLTRIPALGFVLAYIAYIMLVFAPA